MLSCYSCSIYISNVSEGRSDGYTVVVDILYVLMCNQLAKVIHRWVDYSTVLYAIACEATLELKPWSYKRACNYSGCESFDGY